MVVIKKQKCNCEAKRENIFKSENMERNGVKWGFFGVWGGGGGGHGGGGRGCCGENVFTYKEWVRKVKCWEKE